MPIEAKITIGMPVLNGAKVINHALHSVLQQSYRDWQVIVSENCSDDETAKVVTDFVKRDSRINIRVQSQRLPVIENYSRLTQEVNTPYFVFLAADDYWTSDYLAEAVAILEQQPAVVAVSGQVMIGDRLSPGTTSIRGRTATARIRQYLKDPADNSRFYSVFRTPVIQRLFAELPRGFMYGFDWWLMVLSLQQGEHLELPKVSLIRHASPLERYQRQMDREESNPLCRSLPLARFTLQMLRHLPGTTLACWREILWLNYRTWRLRVAAKPGLPSNP